MRRAAYILVLGLVIATVIAPVAVAYLRETATLILDPWEGPGARPGLYYDKIAAQANPAKPLHFWACRDLGRYGMVAPGGEGGVQEPDVGPRRVRP